LNDEGESRADRGARTRAPVRLVPRTFAWLIVFLRWPIIVAWIAAAVLVTVGLPGIPENATDQVGGIAPEHAESLRAEEASLEKFRFPLSSRTMLIQRDPAGLGRGQAAITRKDIRISQDHVPPYPGIQGALPVPNTIPLFPFHERGTAVLSYLFPATYLSAEESTAVAEHLAALRRDIGPAPQVDVTGSIPAQVEQATVISDNLIWLDIATVVLVLVIVGLHFRALLPPLISVAGVAIAFLVSTRLASWGAERLGVPISNQVTPVMTVLLFGVLTDYSIFLMARFRTLLEEEGIERVQVAARRCTGELLPVIVTAGLVIALATGSLYFADLGFLHALGPGLALTVLIAMLVGATFVPAVLAAAGPQLVPVVEDAVRQQAEAFERETSERLATNQVLRVRAAAEGPGRPVEGDAGRVQGIDQFVQVTVGAVFLTEDDGAPGGPANRVALDRPGDDRVGRTRLQIDPLQSGLCFLLLVAHDEMRRLRVVRPEGDLVGVHAATGCDDACTQALRQRDQALRVRKRLRLRDGERGRARQRLVDAEVLARPVVQPLLGFASEVTVCDRDTGEREDGRGEHADEPTFPLFQHVYLRVAGRRFRLRRCTHAR